MGQSDEGARQIWQLLRLHGAGPAGTYYTIDNHTPTAKFPVDQGFPQSGAVFTRNLSPFMTAGLGQRPYDFFTVLNQHGYATGNPNYPAIMTNTDPGNRGAYALARACTGQP